MRNSQRADDTETNRDATILREAIVVTSAEIRGETNGVLNAEIRISLT